jgi:hypothetical protein
MAAIFAARKLGHEALTGVELCDSRCGRFCRADYAGDWAIDEKFGK